MMVMAGWNTIVFFVDSFPSTLSLSWNMLEPSLQAATILGQGTSPASFCTLCRECNHASSHCALAQLQQHPQLPPVTPPSLPPSVNRQPKRIETLLHICVAWNKGICKRVNCTFRHICATCQQLHKARDCPTTPADSEYKLVALLSSKPSTPPRMTSSTRL